MTGIEQPSFEMLKLQRAVDIALFHHNLEFRPHKVRPYLLDVAINRLGKLRFLFRKSTAQFINGVEQDHGKAEPA